MRKAGAQPFVKGLFASTEMFIDQLLDLYRAGVLRRRVYDCLPLERLLASGAITERVDEHMLEALIVRPAWRRSSRRTSFRELQEYGVFRRDVEFCERAHACSRRCMDRCGSVERRCARADRARVSRTRAAQRAGAACGILPRPARVLCRACASCDESDRAQLGMRGVAYVNQLYGPDMELRTLQRRDARFVNTTMMITLLGAAVSDGLADGRVVSGVGGQYNFVSMAHALPGGRSILCLRATRTSGGQIDVEHRVELRARDDSASSARYRRHRVRSCGPARPHGQRNHRCVAEHRRLALPGRAAREGQGGAQDCAGLSHSGGVSREHAAAAGERVRRHRAGGFFSEYPFGTDLTAEEIVLARALKLLQSRTATRAGKLRTLAAALVSGRHRRRNART